MYIYTLFFSYKCCGARIARPVWPAASLASLHGRRFDVVQLRERLLGSFALELKRPRCNSNSIYEREKMYTTSYREGI